MDYKRIFNTTPTYIFTNLIDKLTIHLQNVILWHKVIKNY